MLGDILELLCPHQASRTSYRQNVFQCNKQQRIALSYDKNASNYDRILHVAALVLQIRRTTNGIVLKRQLSNAFFC